MGGPELLYGLQRLAIAACEAFEDRSLFVGQCLADDGDQKDAPCLPTVAGKERSEIGRALQSLPHRDELAEPHSEVPRIGGLAKCAARGPVGFARGFLSPSR
jgi:hypothetical protein